MENLLGILVLAGIVVAVWLWGKAKSAAWKAANQKVLMRRAHTDGQHAVTTATTFTTSATGAAILEKVQGFGWPTKTPKSVIAEVYVLRATETQIEFASGNMLGQSFRSTLTMTADPAGGTTGTYRVIEWKEGDGIVGDIKQMRVVADRVRAAITELDASATFTNVTEAKSSSPTTGENPTTAIAGP